MAPLPRSRVTPFRAFGRTGIDSAGPFHVLAAKGRGVRTTKGYITIFVCLTTKALHLELVGDLSTVSFYAALTRFSGRRGKPSELWSNNATCFHRADTELRDALRLAEHRWDLVASCPSGSRYRVAFYSTRAPHFGGLWEAVVKSIKGHLRRVMGSRHLTYEEFSTVLVGIKAVLNNRPLTPLSGNTDDLGVLTPSHFLIGAPLNSIIEAAPPDQDLDHLAQWELVRGIRAQFWARWSREYLNTLQQRSKWITPHRNLTLGDIVTVLDSSLLSTDGRWHLGRITGVHPGPDGLVSAVTVRTATGEYTRPITKVTLLPMITQTASQPASPGGKTALDTVGGT
ncbi:uncharacterized protein LOC106637014 [Copidosoma floridanum]|uniref:uncharacterized protein LOC106637014 n=1 Tax=Copidosoma floridanum TaxID=29053 RepID=UPI0006C9ABD6|nr:uncharacterized protein LOC106637014 [Copidosoma floridanum]